MMTQTILDLVKSDPIDVDALEKAFDDASHDERVAATRQFSGKLQKRLFEAVEGRAVTARQLMPVDTTLTEVIHEGTNTLPAFRAFQKRFAKPTETQNRETVGYNHNWYAFAAAAGYFIGYQEGDEFVIDYTQLPTEKDAAWPKIGSNKFGLGIFIWTGMKDRLRRVSDHVTIGRAFRNDKPMNAYFVLVRCDP